MDPVVRRMSVARSPVCRHACSMQSEITRSESEHAVTIRGLTKRYGSVEALHGIDLDIRRGETFALLGPNGAGKSTTIEILEGYRDRDAGEVSVLGVDPRHGRSAWRARLGMVLQSTGEHGAVTVREQLAFFARLYPHPRDVDQVIAAVGLTEKAKTRIDKLSGGQRRRVDVALGFVGRPELLFLDEPTTGFDPEARREFWALIRELQAEGTTILLTTHYLDEAAQLSQRGAVIAGGSVVAEGAIDELGGASARVPIVRWSQGGVMREERTEHPAALVARLAEAGEPEALEVVRPSLEDVYLGLIGRNRGGAGTGDDSDIDTDTTGEAAA